MAESQVGYCKSGTSSDVSEREKHKEDENVPVVPECAVCLQQCIHPARLPCNHVFCFLCVKGVANQSKRCPMCRQEIPPDFLERPQLVEVDHLQKKDTVTEVDESLLEEYQWFYEGRNGWWQYDERTSQELETAFKQAKRTCELLIAGFLYIADFTSMLQYRRNDPARKRRIKRDLFNAPKKGVAGIRLNNPSGEQEEPQQEMVREIRGAERPASPTGDGTSTPIPPSNTPQTPATGTTSGDVTPSNVERLVAQQQPDSFHEVLEQMRLALRDESSIRHWHRQNYSTRTSHVGPIIIRVSDEFLSDEE